MNNTYDFCDEAYEIVKSVIAAIETIHGHETVKIEVWHSLKDGHFSSRAYKREHVTAQPTYPLTGASHDKKPESMEIWVSYDLPWTQYDSIDAVISRAMGFLKERSSVS